MSVINTIYTFDVVVVVVVVVVAIADANAIQFKPIQLKQTADLHNAQHPLTRHAPCRLHFVVRGTVLRCRPGDGSTNNGQVIITGRRKGPHKVSPLMMGVVMMIILLMLMMMMMMRGRRCQCRGYSRSRCCRCCCMLVLLVAAVGLEFRAWYTQLFDLGQIGFHAGFANALLLVCLSAC